MKECMSEGVNEGMSKGVREGVREGVSEGLKGRVTWLSSENGAKLGNNSPHCKSDWFDAALQRECH